MASIVHPWSAGGGRASIWVPLWRQGDIWGVLSDVEKIFGLQISLCMYLVMEVFHYLPRGQDGYYFMVLRVLSESWGIKEQIIRKT